MPVLGEKNYTLKFAKDYNLLPKIPRQNKRETVVETKMPSQIPYSSEATLNQDKSFASFDEKEALEALKTYDIIDKDNYISVAIP